MTYMLDTNTCMYMIKNKIICGEKDASIPLPDVLTLCDIEETELKNTEGIEFE